MRPLPNRYKRALAVALAAVLGASSAQASVYTNSVATILGSYGTTLARASASQLQKATMQAIAADPSHAGDYVHDVLLARADRDIIAVNLATGALVSGSAVLNSNADLAVTIVNMATKSDLQTTGTGAPLSIPTIENITTGVVKKMPVGAQAATALNSGDLVAQNLIQAQQSDFVKTYAQDVITKLPGIAAQGRFAGGVGRNISDSEYVSFIKTLSSLAPKAEGEICYAVVALSGSASSAVRIAASEAAATTLADGVNVVQKGLVAQGLVKASGTAHTAQIIANVLATNPSTKNQVLYGNIVSFTSSVAAGLAKDVTMDQAEGVMRLITSTIASGTYSKTIALSGTITLTATDKAKLGAAAVKVAPVSLAGADKAINPPNPANAAVQGILDTGIANTDKTAFAIAVAKGASNYENAGQVVNAVAHSLGINVTGTADVGAYVALSGSVIKALPKATAAITQRVAQLIPPSANQAVRVEFATQLTAQFAGSASLIAVGVSNTDPQFADAVTTAILTKGTVAVRNNAAKIAGAVANTIPAEYASEVSQAAGALVGTGTGAILKLSQAAAIAKAIASAASVKNNQEELQVVSAQMIGQLLSLWTPGDFTGAVNKTVLGAITAVAKSVSQVAFAANTTKLNPSASGIQNTRYVDQIAGSAAQMVANMLSTHNDDINFITNAISAALVSVTTTPAGDSAVAAAISQGKDLATKEYATDNHYLNSDETPVTNY
jgi:uncharacterized membrane protein